MKTFLKGYYNPNQNTRRTISLAAWSGIGVFFFVILFDPFGLSDARISETLFLVAGIGMIAFLSFLLFLVALPQVFPKWFQTGEWEEGPSDLLNFLNWAFSAIGVVFYIRYVAHIIPTIPLVVRIVLICLMPSILARVDMHIASLRRRIEALSPASVHEVPPPRSEVEIRSDSGAEIARIPSDRLLCIKAADNYIEVFFRDGGEIRSRLVRTTLKRACADLSPFPRILRCHRAFVVNLDMIERIRKSPKGTVVEIRGVDEPIPVSRAYQIKVRESLER